MQDGVLEAFVELLKGQDTELLYVVLDALERLLECGVSANDDNTIVNDFEFLGGLSALESLQLHSSTDIYHKVIHILERFFFKATEINAIMA